MDRMVTLHADGYDFDTGGALARALAALEEALRSYSPGRDRRAATLLVADVLLDGILDADPAE
jgi:hypothetical protein